MKELIKSVLSTGSASPHFREFYSICIKMSLSNLCITKNKMLSNEMREKLGMTLHDLAEDCISDLFETEENLFVQINNYFHKILGSNLEQAHNDEIKAYLAILIKSKTNQQLSELREASGDIYFKIRKAVTVYLARNKSAYKKIQSNGSLFFYNCNQGELNFDLPEIDPDFLLQELYEMKFRNCQVPEIVRAIFEITNKQIKYSRAICYNNLLKILKLFYISRFNDHQL